MAFESSTEPPGSLGQEIAIERETLRQEATNSEDTQARKRRWYHRLGFLAPVLLLATKLKTVLLLLPKLKYFSTLISAVISIGAYSLFWGWTFALGFVVLLFCHEMGHVIQLRREGIKASTPMFIPFMGAVIAAKSLGNDAVAEARVGLAGPIGGAIATLVPLGLWLVTGEPFWQALAYVGFFLNLFNLLPVTPLDGGRAMAAVSPWIWVIGLLALVPAFLLLHSVILVLIGIVGGIEAFIRLRAHSKAKREGHVEQLAYFQTTLRQKLLVIIVFVALAAALAYGMSATFVDPGTL